MAATDRFPRSRRVYARTGQDDVTAGSITFNEIFEELDVDVTSEGIFRMDLSDENKCRAVKVIFGKFMMLQRF